MVQTVCTLNKIDMKYRVLILMLCIFSLSLESKGQSKDTSSIGEHDIIGIWQVNTAVISSTLHANFQFFKNGRFVYNTDTYDDLNPIISIYGTYHVQKRI